MGVLATWRFIADHPLTSHRRVEALSRWIRWQVGTRILGLPVVVSFVNGTRLLVRTGMTGATGCVYCGLHEFEEMSFFLHLLRPGDLFVDVGANIGSYSILAAAVGAEVLSFEPLPQTFAALVDNVRLNQLERLVDARNEGLGSSAGVLTFTADLDTANHVVPEHAVYPGVTRRVSVSALDTALGGRAPVAIKFDVEGYEAEVLRGASSALANPSLSALVIELNGCGRQFGSSDEDVHRHLLDLRFRPCIYDPFKRQVTEAPHLRRTRANNVVYVRDIARVQSRVERAPSFQVLNERI